MVFVKNKKGTIFELKDNKLRIIIHKIHGCNDALFLSCYKLGIEDKDLQTEDFNIAVNKSKELIRQRIEYLLSESKRFTGDDSDIRFSDY